MKVGLLADTHDNLDAIRYFVDWFNSKNVSSVIHAGDFVSPFTVPELDQFNGTVYGVFGNNDGDRGTLTELSEGTDVSIEEPPRRVEMGGLNFVVSHKPSDLPENPEEDVDVYVHGHTHSRSVERSETLTINPGEAGGWLNDSSSAMVLNTETVDLQRQVVPRP